MFWEWERYILGAGKAFLGWEDYASVSFKSGKGRFGELESALGLGKMSLVVESQIWEWERCVLGVGGLRYGNGKAVSQQWEKVCFGSGVGLLWKWERCIPKMGEVVFWEWGGGWVERGKGGGRGWGTCWSFTYIQPATPFAFHSSSRPFTLTCLLLSPEPDYKHQTPPPPPPTLLFLCLTKQTVFPPFFLPAPS